MTTWSNLNSSSATTSSHIGITGHSDSPILMSAIRRDTYDVIDTLLVGLNANDRFCGANQNNVLPPAMAHGMGVIAMKIFDIFEKSRASVTWAPMRHSGTFEGKT